MDVLHGGKAFKSPTVSVTRNSKESAAVYRTRKLFSGSCPPKLGLAEVEYVGHVRGVLHGGKAVKSPTISVTRNSNESAAVYRTRKL